jgi:uncharacterized phage-associated protein
MGFSIPNKTSPNYNVPKIGNLISYVALKVGGTVALTKLLKLLYIIDESAVKKVGMPITGLEYEVWQAGPVAREMYTSVKDSNPVLSDYVAIEQLMDGTQTIIPKIQKIDDNKFAPLELEIIDAALAEHGHKSGGQLSSELHQPNTLWSIAVESNDLKELFKKVNSTTIKIDLSDHIKEDPIRMSIFESSVMARSLK